MIYKYIIYRIQIYKSERGRTRRQDTNLAIYNSSMFDLRIFNFDLRYSLRGAARSHGRRRQDTVVELIVPQSSNCPQSSKYSTVFELPISIDVCMQIYACIYIYIYVYIYICTHRDRHICT